VTVSTKNIFIIDNSLKIYSSRILETFIIYSK